MERVRLGVSGCLLGQQVRFDGGHKRNGFLTEKVEPFAQWVPVCPEVGAGLPIPRPSLRLTTRKGEVRMVTRDGTTDVTEAIASYARGTIEGLRRAQLDGFILKKDSPSCGLDRVRVHDEKGQVRREGRGLFAAALVEMMPGLPIEEEGRLSDPILREAFFERVFAMRRLNDLASKPVSASDLVAFHSASKLQLMSHSPTLTTVLGRLVAHAGRHPDRALSRYRSGYMKALSLPTDRGRHVNVLQHGLGYFKRILGRTARRDLLDAIHGYAAREVPLVVPVSLLAHRARAESVEHLASQIYLEPYPAAMGLRNAI
jgi:uncharacterized protein YbbK (DUF523 family)/uncharacterized protein YbgA (DUF1722 family)